MGRGGRLITRAEYSRRGESEEGQGGQNKNRMRKSFTEKTGIQASKKGGEAIRRQVEVTEK